MTDQKKGNDDELLVIFKTLKVNARLVDQNSRRFATRGAVDEAPTQAAEPETATAAPDAETDIAPGTANLVMNNPNFVNSQLLFRSVSP